MTAILYSFDYRGCSVGPIGVDPPQVQQQLEVFSESWMLLLLTNVQYGRLLCETENNCEALQTFLNQSYVDKLKVDVASLDKKC